MEPALFGLLMTLPADRRKDGSVRVGLIRGCSSMRPEKNSLAHDNHPSGRWCPASSKIVRIFVKSNQWPGWETLPGPIGRAIGQAKWSGRTGNHGPQMAVRLRVVCSRSSPFGVDVVIAVRHGQDGPGLVREPCRSRPRLVPGAGAAVLVRAGRLMERFGAD